MAKLDLISFSNALSQLEGTLTYMEAPTVKEDPILTQYLQAASIQAFEFCYELTMKTIRRFLEASEVTPASVKELSFNNMIRLAYDYGIVEHELVKWKGFRDMRNITSHTYDHSKAAYVFASIPAFLAEARFVLDQLEERNSELE